MKKMVVFLGIVLIPGLLIPVFQSCNPCKGGVEDYRIKGLKGTAFVVTGMYVSGQDTLYNTYPYQEGMVVSYDSLHMLIGDTLYAFIKPFPRNPFWIGSVYGCSPAVLEDYIKSIVVTSTEDYNPSYPRGSNLGPIIRVLPYSRGTGLALAEFLKHPSPFIYNTSFLFSAAPDQARIHDITFNYILSDGRECKATIKGLKIGT